MQNIKKLLGNIYFNIIGALAIVDKVIHVILDNIQ